MKKILATVVLLLALCSISLADIIGSDWYYINKGEIYDIYLDSCYFSPCASVGGGLLINGIYTANWYIQDRIIKIPALDFTGIISKDEQLIYGNSIILIRK